MGMGTNFPFEVFIISNMNALIEGAYSICVLVVQSMILSLKYLKLFWPEVGC